MSSIYGIADNLITVADVAALEAYDVSVPINGRVVGNGQLAQVNTVGLYQYQLNGTSVVDDSTVLSANPIGIWVEYFLATGQNYVAINDDTNTIIGLSLDGATLTAAHIFVGNASNVATDVAVTGDIAISNAGVTSIASGVIVNADVNASAAIAFSKLAALPSANILVGSAGTVATAVAMSGDATISNAGAVTIASSAVTTAKINDAAVTLAKLAPGITPAAIVVAAGTGSYAGGSTTATFTIAGMLDTDILTVTKVTNANASYIITATHSTTTASILLNTDPGASTFAYHLTRAAA